MEDELDIDLYFENYKHRKEDEVIQSVTLLVEHKFPNIQNLEVSMNQVKYADDRYSVEEVTEYVMELFKQKPLDNPMDYFIPLT